MSGELFREVLANLSQSLLQRKPRVLAIVGAVGALVGSIVGAKAAEGNDDGLLAVCLGVGVWDSFICLGIGLPIAYWNARQLNKLATQKSQLLKVAIRCAVGGAVSGICLVLTRGILGGESIGHIAGWTIEGVVMGVSLSSAIPNLPNRLSATAGAAAGFMGGVLTITLLPDSDISIAVADSVKGFFLGAMLPLSETYAAKLNGMLIIDWGPNGTSSILLGRAPVRIGSLEGCQVFCKGRSGQARVFAEISIRDGKPFLIDYDSGDTRFLRTGERLSFRDVLVEVRAAVATRSLS